MSDPRFPYSRGRHADPVPDAPALATDRLSVCYPGTDRVALRNVSVRAGRGSRVALVGPNGAGKSTLLKAAAGLLPVAAGGIRIYGNPVGACHHRVAYLPQRGDIDWTFPIPVSRFVLAGRYVHLGWFRRPEASDRAIVTAVLARLGLAALADRQIGRLSGGQQQRALLARALAQEADLLLLDEPLNAVDAETKDIIYAVMADLRAEGKTLVVATHDLGRLTRAFDTIIHLQNGLLVQPPGNDARDTLVNEEAVWAG
ncbi:MAG: ABC transporter ATP-binding protein [Planctomycetes bacterium]|nr:ABC transporter ATP-binding protein [Planctomycetota bacterium]